MVLPSLPSANVALVSTGRAPVASRLRFALSLRIEEGLGPCSAVGWAGPLRRRTGLASASPALSISSAARRTRRLMTTEVPAPSAQATCGADSSSTLAVMLEISGPASPDRRFVIAPQLYIFGRPRQGRDRTRSADRLQHGSRDPFHRLTERLDAIWRRLGSSRERIAPPEARPARGCGYVAAAGTRGCPEPHSSGSVSRATRGRGKYAHVADRKHLQDG
jgi:hypothetical protein